MSDSPVIPGSHSAPLDARTGMWRGEWYRFLRDLAALPQLTVDQSAEIAALADRVAALEAAGVNLGEILGPGSVLVTGTLGNQVVVQLQGDQDAPGASFYFGTDEAGIKGFHPIPVADSAVPFFIPDGETYTVAENKQALFTIPIDLGTGSGLLIDGILAEVD